MFIRCHALHALMRVHSHSYRLTMLRTCVHALMPLTRAPVLVWRGFVLFLLAECRHYLLAETRRAFGGFMFPKWFQLDLVSRMMSLKNMGRQAKL